jgi:hypothetical protein
MSIQHVQHLLAWLVLLEQVPQEQHNANPMRSRQQQQLLAACKGITSAYRIPLASHETMTSTWSLENIIWWIMTETVADSNGRWQTVAGMAVDKGGEIIYGGKMRF